MSGPSGGTAHERGVALLEIALSMVVLTILAMAVGSVFDTGVGAYETSSPAYVRTMTHRTLDRISEWLSFASFDSILVNADGSAITFKPCLGSTGGTKSVGLPHHIRWRPESEDPPDGKDNDSDGLIDEGLVILILDVGDPNERMVVLARGVARHLEGELDNSLDDNGNGVVDESGLFIRVGLDMLEVSLTLNRQGQGGEIVSTTARTFLARRN